jgi:hypothetical protein
MCRLLRLEEYSLLNRAVIRTNLARRVTLMRQQHTQQHDQSTAHTEFQHQKHTDVENTVEVEETRTNTAAALIEDLGIAVRLRKRALSWLPVPAITLSAALIAVRVLVSHSVTGIRPAYWALLATFLAGNAGMVALLFSGVTRLSKAMRALADTDDIQAVGVMAESLAAGEPALTMAGSALIRLLPHMTREHLEMLMSEQRKALREGLKCASIRRKYTQYNPALVLAILKAFERAGDEADLAVIKKLASRTALTSEQKSIRAAAVSCLAIMRARLMGDPTPQVLKANAASAADTSLSTEAGESLSARLRSLARIRRRNVAVTAAGALVGTGLALLSLSRFSEHATNNVLAASMLSCLAGMIFFALSGTYSQRNLTNALIHSDDLGIVPPLIQAAATIEISGTAAVMLLTRLLPRLRASDASLLDGNDRTLLHTAMVKHAGNREFILAALHALQQIGDRTSIHTVQRLADRTERRAADPELRDAAKECLEFLQQRAALTEANQTLLRSSSAAETPTDTLLRAIDNATPTAPDELLRTTSAPIVYEQSETADVQKNTLAFALQPVG